MCAPSESESESESDNSQNPDGPFNDSSDLPAETESATVPELSPLNELGLSATTEPNQTDLEYIPKEETANPEDPGDPDSSNSSSSSSTPSTHFSEMAAEPGPLPPTTPTAPAVHTPTGLLGDPPEFKGKQTNARTFIDNLEIYFALNPATDNQKVLLALSKISNGAEQWKRNKVTAFNTNLALWHDWEGFKTVFHSNWGEVNTSGTAYHNWSNCNSEE